jgi:heterodisulfide reductase subunit C
MFHVFASPLSLLINAAAGGVKSDPAVIMTRQMIELDACTHCGTCSAQCLMGFTFYEIANRNILPSEKLASAKKLSAGSNLSENDIKNIQEGLYLCTNCTRCTLVCPAGINLQEIWFNVREAFLEKGYPEIYALSQLSAYRGLKRDIINPEKYLNPLENAFDAVKKEYKLFEKPHIPIDSDILDKPFCKSLSITAQSSTFSKCYACTTCTSSCPVVNNYDNPVEILGMVPHQIIHAAVLGAPDMIYRSKMLWNCLGCYECQDACPQGVRVTDVFYELKTRAVTQLKN